MPTTRFAPSPTGRLHLGHAYSALFAAREAGPGGRFLLRMEDIDASRCRPEFASGILEDLGWLGLAWDGEVEVQSERLGRYREALATLRGIGVLYPCFCTGKDIAREVAAIGGAPHGPAGAVYPGTCRGVGGTERERRIASGEGHVWRLDSAAAGARAGELIWEDRVLGEIAVEPAVLGDVVLARKDIGTSYHLAVTVDDADGGVDLVTRGEDLVESTHVHRLLQALLGLPVPVWHHHKLLLGPDGKRFAKRDESVALAVLRESGKTAAEVRAGLGF